MWVGVINASSAWVVAATTNGANDGLIRVSIDGGAPYSAPRVGGRLTAPFVDPTHFFNSPQPASRYELFSGEQRERLVCITFDPATYSISFFLSGYGPLQYRGYQDYIDNVPVPFGVESPAMCIAGFSPSTWSPVAWVQPADSGALSVSSAYVVAFDSNPGYAPPKLPAAVYGVTGTNVPSVRFRTLSARHMIIVATSDYVYVSTDGAPAVRYWHTGVWDARAITVHLDGLAHTYNVWQGNTKGNGAVFSVGVDAPMVDVGDKIQMHQFGDSITACAGSESAGDAETMTVAAVLGCVGSTFGISGETVPQLNARLDALLAGITVNAGDIAIIAEGRNNAVGSWDSTLMGHYDSIIGKLLAKGYRRVLCRGIIGSAAPTTYFPLENASIQSVVTARADARVRFVDTSAWQVTSFGSNGGVGIQLADNVHPTAAGYKTMVPLAVAAYSPLI